MRDVTKFRIYVITGFTVAALSLLAFGMLAKNVMYHQLDNFDNNLITYVWKYRNPTLTIIVKFITFLGSVYTVVSVALVAFYFLSRVLKHYQEASLVTINLFGGWLLNEILKYSFHRPRPNVSRLITESGYSFPSGHAMIGATFYGFLAYLFYLNLKRPYREFSVVFFVILTILIGVSRIYLGVHYPSDVIAGYFAGASWLVACMLALHTIRYYRSAKRNTPERN